MLRQPGVVSPPILVRHVEAQGHEQIPDRLLRRVEVDRSG